LDLGFCDWGLIEVAAIFHFGVAAEREEVCSAADIFDWVAGKAFGLDVQSKWCSRPFAFSAEMPFAPQPHHQIPSRWDGELRTGTSALRMT